MGTLEPGALGNPRHAAVLACQQILEVDTLERFPRFTIRPIQRYFGRRSWCGSSGEHAFDVFQTNLLVERCQAKVLDDAFELCEVSRPGVMPQRVQPSDGESPRWTGAGLDELRQHQGGQVRDV